MAVDLKVVKKVLQAPYKEPECATLFFPTFMYLLSHINSFLAQERKPRQMTNLVSFTVSMPVSTESTVGEKQK